MKTYKVTITETLRMEVEVEAHDRTEAECLGIRACRVTMRTTERVKVSSTKRNFCGITPRKTTSLTRSVSVMTVIVAQI
ncbi:hypothetical protein FACS1894191_3450 [Clostridia bacterium]|nr:hypothetical protein FACS1894191_3450 [Clostridia bacterium]